MGHIAMINEKDLRIGNWVKHLDHHLQVIEISKHMICCDPHWGFDNFDDIEGIPLSPEILQKAGFEKQKYFSDKYSWVNGIYLISLNGWFQQKINITSAIILSENIHYLHQLQNLFYSLTGTELIINL